MARRLYLLVWHRGDGMTDDIPWAFRKDITETLPPGPRVDAALKRALKVHAKNLTAMAR
jgi:hypothetical protein